MNRQDLIRAWSMVCIEFSAKFKRSICTDFSQFSSIWWLPRLSGEMLSPKILLHLQRQRTFDGFGKCMLIDALNAYRVCNRVCNICVWRQPVKYTDALPSRIKRANFGNSALGTSKCWIQHFDRVKLSNSLWLQITLSEDSLLKTVSNPKS